MSRYGLLFISVVFMSGCVAMAPDRDPERDTVIFGIASSPGENAEEIAICDDDDPLRPCPSTDVFMFWKK